MSSDQLGHASNTGDMVLGSLLSLQQQILNSTSEDSYKASVVNETIPINRQFIPVFELVLGTITYVVSF